VVVSDGGGAAAASSAVSVRREPDGIAIVELSRPPVNALDRQTIEELTATFATTAEQARGVVLTGAGRCFSAGVDVKWAASADANERALAVRAINRMVSVVYSAPIPCVAAINGHAHGGGLVLALACDLRVATDGDASLALDEAAAGIPFPAGPLEVVRAELDPSVARELTLTARPFDTKRGLALRVLDELVSDTGLLDRALALARELAAHPAYGAVKSQLRAATAARLAAAAADGAGEQQPASSPGERSA
jgi:enoyl-CoA hydratase